ncbi:MAG TPA: arylesterase, partial [Verrucomicrobiales bacterium]|nr:arylesterase [Verrucomicrobiales bacterium]
MICAARRSRLNLWLILIALGLLGGIFASLEGAEGMPTTASKTVIILGDSLAAGFGVDPADAFPAQLQTKITTAKLP